MCRSRFKSALATFQQNAEDPRTLWDDVIEYMADKERQVWRTEGRSAGTPWLAAKARSRRTVTRGGKSRRSSELMRLSSNLLVSLAKPRGRGGIRRKTRSELVYGTKNPVARLHQNGSKGGRLPARPPLTITDQDERAQVELVRRHVFAEAGRLSGGMGAL